MPENNQDPGGREGSIKSQTGAVSPFPFCGDVVAFRYAGEPEASLGLVIEFWESADGQTVASVRDETGEPKELPVSQLRVAMRCTDLLALARRHLQDAKGLPPQQPPPAPSQEQGMGMEVDR